MYNDIKNYINNCPICQAVHHTKHRKPEIKQIITYRPKEWYVLDLQKIKNYLQDKSHKYKYFFNIIDHYSKLMGSYLLPDKEAKTVLNNLNNFNSICGIPESIQSDNGLEFRNKLLNKYYIDNNIKIIHSSVKHLTTNGVVERIHQAICNSMYAE